LQIPIKIVPIWLRLGRRQSGGGVVQQLKSLYGRKNGLTKAGSSKNYERIELRMLRVLMPRRLEDLNN
jgi:hypothetical protein